jgi:hypothetical protein
MFIYGALWWLYGAMGTYVLGTQLSGSGLRPKCQPDVRRVSILTPKPAATK